MPHGTRLYSIAASRYGDTYEGKTTTLCVRRATYWCPELQAEDPSKKGICSNFLCDAKPGDEITMTGELPLINTLIFFLPLINTPSI
jgi:ferredoxin--NADP+ reductase